VQGATKQMRDLPEQAKYDIALRIYELMQYDDTTLAKTYIDHVRGVFRRDSPSANTPHRRGDLESREGDAHQG